MLRNELRQNSSDHFDQIRSVACYELPLSLDLPHALNEAGGLRKKARKRLDDIDRERHAVRETGEHVLRECAHKRKLIQQVTRLGVGSKVID